MVSANTASAKMEPWLTADDKWSFSFFTRSCWHLLENLGLWVSPTYCLWVGVWAQFLSGCPETREGKVKVWLLLCCCRIGISSIICWDLLRPSRRVGKGKCNVVCCWSTVSTSLICVGAETQLSLGYADTGRKEERKLKISEVGWNLSPYLDLLTMVNGRRVSSSPVSSGLF